jgi:3-oxoacyl-[acyl-carrier-protein] synthase-3
MFMADFARALGRQGARVTSVYAACASGARAIDTARAQILSGMVDTVLVVGAEVLTRYLDMDDRRTAALIGDGAGAALMTAVDPPGRIGPCVLRADDTSREVVYMTRDELKLRMEGQQTFVTAVANLTDVTQQAVDAAGMTLDGVDLFVYHQANARIIRAVGERLGLPGSR